MSAKNEYWANKVALVTGGGSGIGLAFCQELSRVGCSVWIVDIDSDAAVAAAKSCGPNATAYHLDVSDNEAYQTCVKEIFDKDGKLDFLFNNAGIALAGEVHEFVPEAWNRIINVNIKGVVNGVSTVYPLMKKQGFGHIINTSSLSGVVPSALFTPYSMTKFAIVGLSNSLRLEAKEYGIRVTVLCPAFVDTPLLDKGNPTDLPKVESEPNVRKYLGEITGTPDSASTYAKKMLIEIPKDQAMIFYPKKAREIWKIGRYFPSLLSKLGDKALAKERKERG